MKRKPRKSPGLIASLLLAFFTSSAHADQSSVPLSLNTEDYPPFNYLAEDGVTLTGLSVEILDAVFKRAGQARSMYHYPWKRAYSLALRNPDSCVFSTTKTEEREPLFKWVGPLVRNNWVIIARKSDNMRARRLEDVRRYIIGGYAGDAVSLYLSARGFQMNNAVKDSVNPRLLQNSRIDLWATGHLLGPYYARKAGVTDLEILFEFRKTVMSLACNRKVPDAVINRLNQALRTLVEDGTAARLEERYN